MNKKINLIINAVLGIPKTIWFNFKVFKFCDAIRLPILITNNIKIKEVYKGCVEIQNKNKKIFMIKLGISGSDAISSSKGLIFISKKNKAKIIFENKAMFAEGIKIYNNYGTTFFGDNFISNKNCSISCDREIYFGKDVLLGWNVNIRDSDGHKIFDENILTEERKKIVIGNHVWICAFVDILKGNVVGNDSVIAYRSCLTGKEYGDNCLIAGYPGKIIKENINWEK